MINYFQKNTNLLKNEKFKIVVNKFLNSDFNHIFNEIDFFKLHSKNNNDLYIQLVRITDEKVFANITFYINNSGHYSSPIRGTFGGVSAKEHIDFLLLEEFLVIAINEYLKKNSTTINIKLQPFSHDLSLCSICLNIFLRLNFSVISYDLNYSLRINNDLFISKVSYGNRKKIKQCLRDGFYVSILDISRYGEVYKVIESNRNSKGYPMTMDLPGFLEMTRVFPDRIHCFAVFNSSDLSIVAASICISINPYILYVFYWGDALSNLSYSPITLLASKIYDFAKENSYSILDVGTSTINNNPNYGLINFKKNMGFEESIKLTLEFKSK